MSKVVIAIDGPAGAGKSTVAKRIARELSLRFLDTGAMYRALALKALRAGVSAEDGEAVAALGETTEIGFSEGDPQRVFLDGEDVTSAIREPYIGDLASSLSVYSPVRRLLVRRQRDIVATGGVVLEGRDTTSVIAPNAPVRVFLTASLDERARRRTAELEARGLIVDPDSIRAQIAERDHRDMNREDSPLHVADGVVVVETDGLSIDEVVARIRGMVEAS